MGLFMLIVILALGWFVYFEVKERKKQEGIWRTIFLLPMFFVIGITGWVFIEVSNNSGSHNLLPFELIAYLFYGIIAHFLLVILKGLLSKANAKK